MRSTTNCLDLGFGVYCLGLGRRWFRKHSSYEVATISTLLKSLGLFCRNGLFYRALLQKRL